MKYICLLLVLLFAEFADAAPIENCSAEIEKALISFKSKRDSRFLPRYTVNDSVRYIDKESMPGVEWRNIHGVRFIDFDYDGDFDVVFDMQDYHYLMPEIYFSAGEINKSDMNELVKDSGSKRSKVLISSHIKNLPLDTEEVAAFLIENELLNMIELESFTPGVDIAYRQFIQLNGSYYALALLNNGKNAPIKYHLYALNGRKLSSVCQYQSK